MDTVPFVDRVAELSVLEREYRSPGFRLVVVYGRRRVGKTRLLREWLRSIGGVYFVAAEVSYRRLCEEFAEAVSRSLRIDVPALDIVEVLEYIARRARDRIVVVIDEFQYLVEADESLPSRLMRSIDGALGSSSIMLVLCGSAVSFIERKLLGYRAPLFGRTTARIKLKPLRFLDALPLMYGIEDPLDTVRLYSILGGTPAYLSQAYGVRSLGELLRKLLAPGSPLLDELPNLLRQEVREPRSYLSIIIAIAEGATSPSEAAQRAGLDPRNASKYIEILEEMDLVKRTRPLGYRRGYRVMIVDEYARFWAKYLAKLRNLIELGLVDEAASIVESTIDSFAAETFERAVESSLPELHRLGVVPAVGEVGKWWYRGEEIDLVIRAPRYTTFIECKWSDIDASEGRELLENLAEKAARTGLAQERNRFVVVARRITGTNRAVNEVDKDRHLVDYSRIIEMKRSGCI